MKPGSCQVSGEPNKGAESFIGSYKPNKINDTVISRQSIFSRIYRNALIGPAGAFEPICAAPHIYSNVAAIPSRVGREDTRPDLLYWG